MRPRSATRSATGASPRDGRCWRARREWSWHAPDHDWRKGAGAVLVLLRVSGPTATSCVKRQGGDSRYGGTVVRLVGAFEPVVCPAGQTREAAKTAGVCRAAPSPDRIWGRIDTSIAERTTVPPYHLDARWLSYSELVPACQHPLLFDLVHCIRHPGGMPVDQQWLTTAHNRV